MEGLAKNRSKSVKSSNSSGQGSRPGEKPSPLPLERPSSDLKLGLAKHREMADSLVSSESEKSCDMDRKPSLAMPSSSTHGTLDRNNETRSAGQDLSDNQLRDVARTLGPKWEQAAFRLGLKTEDLNKIKAEQKAEFMQKRKMLLLWKCRRPPGEATAQDLLRGLEALKDLPVETRQLLNGSSLTKDTARMSLEDRHEEEDRSDSGLAKNRSKSVKSNSSGQGSRPGEKPSSLPLERPSSDRKLDRNNETRSAGQALSEKQLMQVAETLGQEWEQAAFHLDLETKDLEDIKAEQTTVVMQKQKMLVLWKRRRPPGEATAQHLLRGLEALKDLPVETRQLLNDMMN